MNSTAVKFIFIQIIIFICVKYSNGKPSEPVYVIETTRNEQNSIVQTLQDSPVFQQLKDILLQQNELVDIIAPVMVRAITSPVPGLAEALVRSLALFGVTSYLVGPTISRSARELGPVMEPIVGPTDNLMKQMDRASELEPLLENVLIFFGFDNDQCRQAIACHAGSQVAKDYPFLASYLAQITSQTRSVDDKYANILVQVLSSSNNSECTMNCPNLLLLENYWKEAGKKDFLTIARDALGNALK